MRRLKVWKSIFFIEEVFLNYISRMRYWSFNHNLQSFDIYIRVVTLILFDVRRISSGEHFVPLGSALLAYFCNSILKYSVFWKILPTENKLMPIKFLIKSWREWNQEFFYFINFYTQFYQYSRKYTLKLNYKNSINHNWIKTQFLNSISPIKK